MNKKTNNVNETAAEPMDCVMMTASEIYRKFIDIRMHQLDADETDVVGKLADEHDPEKIMQLQKRLKRLNRLGRFIYDARDSKPGHIQRTIVTLADGGELSPEHEEISFLLDNLVALRLVLEMD